MYDIDFSENIYGREERNTVKPLTDPRHQSDRSDDPKKVNEELLDHIEEVKPKCGIFCSLSDEKQGQNQRDTISPIKEQPASIPETYALARRIKRNLMVSGDERKNIALATNQIHCQEWFSHRRVRITASKCKRALLKPLTSPRKAMRGILHYN